MRAAPFRAEGNGAVELAGSIEALLWPEDKGGGRPLVEPTSVLDCRWSPSPPNSASTLSSSLVGGAAADSTGVATVSDNSAPAAKATKWAAHGEHGGGGGGRKEEWGGGELPPMPGALDVGFIGEESWEAMLGDAAAAAGQEQTFLNWIMAGPGDMETPAPALQQQQQLLGNASGFGLLAADPLGFSLQRHPGGATSPAALASDLSSSGGRSLASSNGSNSRATSTFGLLSPEAVLQPPPAMTMPFHDGADIKPSLLGVPSASLLLNQHQPTPASTFFMPLPSFPDHQQEPLLQPPPKRHHSMPDNLFLLQNQLRPPLPPTQCLPFSPLHNTTPFQLWPSPQPPQSTMKTTAAAAQQQQHLLDELAAAAKAAEVGNSIGAREILARLNQQFPPIGKPFLRSASYLKEALLLALADGHPGSTRLTSPLDVVLKLAAYKSFSDLSPVLQFANFTATQALLDEIACTTASCIHIIDFDLGVGGQWASFLQELSHRHGTGGVSLPMLKLTAFVSAASHHPLELHLTRDNLSQFASDLGIPFEFHAIDFDVFDPVELVAPKADEVVAVSLPIGCSARTPPLPVLLQLVKQLAPKIVVAIDHGSDRGDLPFSQHFLNCFQSCMFLLDSLDAAGADAEAASKIERFLIQPRVEDAVLGRRRADKALAWRTVFASAGFAPVPLSNIAEAQADCLLKRVQVRGFHVEKRGVGLALYWQRGELVSVSAWRC